MNYSFLMIQYPRFALWPASTECLRNSHPKTCTWELRNNGYDDDDDDHDNYDEDNYDDNDENGNSFRNNTIGFVPSV